MLHLDWRNRRNGHPLRGDSPARGEAGCVRLKTYRDIVAEYRLHPEAKSGDPRIGPGIRSSVGLLPPAARGDRRRAEAIGKESNRLEEVEEGAIVEPGEVCVDYRRREWEAALAMLRRPPSGAGLAAPWCALWAL